LCQEFKGKTASVERAGYSVQGKRIPASAGMTGGVDSCLRRGEGMWNGEVWVGACGGERSRRRVAGSLWKDLTFCWNGGIKVDAKLEMPAHGVIT
jgi:hypothetical protein